MTAIGESTLRVLDRGDAVGPDSRGLFQQRDNGAWGTYEERMDPYISATNFFKKELKVKGRETLAPTLVANRVQVNADPYHYEPFWDDAGVVVQALAGKVIPAESPATAAASAGCGGGVDGPVGISGWAEPAKGPMTSNYGPRSSSGVESTWHKGIDFGGGGCDGPIWAANAGTVVKAGPHQGQGNQIRIDHGEGITTSYGHMYTAGVLVRVGDVVTAGQQIGKVGSAGNSTGCHLHFEVWRDDQRVDPEAFLDQVGPAAAPAVAPAAVPAATTAYLTVTLRKGNSNYGQNKTLQRRLNALGAKLTVDGRFGAKTLAAVKKYQRSKGLQADGIVGPKTRKALKLAGTASAPAAASRSTSRSAINTARAAMWDRIAQCESGGRWNINTGNGYYGGLQFDYRTWLSVNGDDFAPRADKASRAEQITVANRLYAKRGLQPWGCRHAA